MSRGTRLVVLQSETGSGKTVTASHIIRLAYEKGKRCLFIVSGRILVKQCSKQLTAMGVPHGIIMSGVGPSFGRPIQVASKDTFSSWFKKELASKDELPEHLRFDLVIPDECHETLAKQWLRIIHRLAASGSRFIGLTATPVRGDGRSLSPTWEAIVQGPRTSWLIDNGYIVGTKVYAPYRPNLKGVKKLAGEYVSSDLVKRMDKPVITGDAVEHWKRLGEGRPTIAYCIRKDHADHVRDCFVKHGITCRTVFGTTTDEERQEVFSELKSGKLSVVSSVGVMAQGVDIPEVSCGIMLRPCLSYRLFRQMVGRLRRRHPGKQNCILLDHSGCCYTHGLPDEDVDWRLGDEETIQNKVSSKKKEKGEKDPFCCARCYCMYVGPSCPNCGHVPRRVGKLIESAPGVLVPVDGVPEIPEEVQIRYWRKCIAVAANRDAAFSSAGAMYAYKFGRLPPGHFPHVPGADRDQWAIKVRQALPQYVRTRR